MLILEEVQILIEQTDKREKAKRTTSASRKLKDGLGYSFASIPYFIYKRYTDDPSHPRIKSTPGRLAARFGSQAIGQVISAPAGAAAGGLIGKAIGGNEGAAIGGALGGAAGLIGGGVAGHMLGSKGKSGYYCPPGYMQDPKNPDRCIRKK